MRRGTHRAEAWADLSRVDPTNDVFDPEELSGLPGPGRRMLHHALGAGCALGPAVRLEMEGEIKLKNWAPFRARQVLRAGEGFVWEAVAGKAPLRVEGGDSYWHGSGDLDFRLWGMIPVASASGPDVDRSAAGRLAAETVFWAPQTLVPRLGARWSPIDDERSNVAVPLGGETVDIVVTVDHSGRLQEISTQRWGNPDQAAFDFHPFGAAVEKMERFGDITIVSAGRVGWWWGTERQDEGEFFRFTITDAWTGTEVPE